MRNLCPFLGAAKRKTASPRSRLCAAVTLGNMRATGVRMLAIACLGRGCYHQAILDVTEFDDDVPVPAFGARMVCTACGAIGADARRNWQERASAIFSVEAHEKKPRQQRRGSKGRKQEGYSTFTVNSLSELETIECEARHIPAAVNAAGRPMQLPGYPC
jgi:hypothetical protein